MPSAVDRSVAPSPRPADFLATNRGGGLFSEAVSQPAGSVIAFVGFRFGLTPTALSLANLTIGLAVAVVVTLLAGPASAGDVPAWLPGLVALVGWQLAYAFDCADGQLARVSDQCSAAGARLDVLCDVAVQIGLVVAVSTIAGAQRPTTPTWLVAAFAGTWMVNMVTSVMQAGPNSGSMVTSRSLAVRAIKLVRDYGAVTFVTGLVLLIAPMWTIGVLAAFTVINGGFLLASIAFTGRR